MDILWLAIYCGDINCLVVFITLAYFDFRWVFEREGAGKKKKKRGGRGVRGKMKKIGATAWMARKTMR